MIKDRQFSDDSFEESDQYSDQGFDHSDDTDTIDDESGRRTRKRKGHASSRQRIDEFQEARWLRTHLQDWDDWDDERPAF
jgi:hypothetical protein